MKAEEIMKRALSKVVQLHSPDAVAMASSPTRTALQSIVFELVQCIADQETRIAELERRVSSIDSEGMGK